MDSKLVFFCRDGDTRVLGRGRRDAEPDPNRGGKHGSRTLHLKYLLAWACLSQTPPASVTGCQEAGVRACLQLRLRKARRR